MAASPSSGRAARVERSTSRGAHATHDLYERFSGQIFGYCLHQLGSREEAEDAVQTTFMNALRGLQRGIVPEVESAWLFKIAHNVCLSRRRSTWRRGRVEAPNNLEVLQEVIPARERTGDDLIRLHDALEQMPESQRRAILLREWQGLSYREIADELGLSQSAVETLIFRARRALAAGLEETPVIEGRGWSKRARHGLDAGAVLTALKALLSGGTAVKVAATAAAVTTAIVASTEHRSHRSMPVKPKPAPVTVRQVDAHPVSVTVAPARQPQRASDPAPVVHRAVPPSPARQSHVSSLRTPVVAPPVSTPTPPAQTVEHAEPPRAQHEAAPAAPKPAAAATDSPKQHGDARETQAAIQPQPPVLQSGDSTHGTPPGQQDKADKSNGNGHK